MHGIAHRAVKALSRGNARRLRADQTDAEAAMWRLLRSRRLAGFKFRRQVPFQSYILDFVCFERRLIIEVDGSQHASSTHDVARTIELEKEGFRVLRYWNNDVLLRQQSVLEDIFNHLGSGQD